MAWNGLVKKLKRGFGRAVRIGMALAVLGSASCKLPIPTPNNLPTAILSVAPTEINTGESSRIQINGFDLDGEEDIIEYKIGEDKNDDGDIDDYNETIKASSNPINEKIIFNTSGIKKIYGQVMDSQGAIGKDGPVLVDVASVLAWPPEFDSSLDEEIEKTIVLPSEDKGGNPVSYTSATPQNLNQFEKVSLSENQLILKGNVDEIGDYQINLEFESSGKTYNETIEGILYDCLDIEGQLQDNETDSPQTGTIRVYDNSSTPAFLGEISTDATNTGYFEKQLNKRVLDLPGIIVQAGIDDNQDGNLESYVRTRKFLAGDVRDLIIRAVPYDGPLSYDDGLIPKQMTPEQARAFIDEMHFSSKAVTGNPFPGLKKWNFGELSDIKAHPIFKEIAIIKYNPYNDDYFVEPENIRTKLRNSLHPKAGEITIEIYDYIPPAPFGLGRGIIVPDDTPGDDGTAAGVTYVNDQVEADGYFESFWTELKPVNESDSGIIRHEVLGHGLNGSGHTTLNGALMNPSPSTEDFSPLEIKGSYIVGHPAYKGMEGLDAILKMNFY